VNLPLADAGRVIAKAIRARVFPAAAVEVGSSEELLWSQAFGMYSFDEGSPPATPDTVFDLASLTKPLATTSVAMQLVSDRCLSLDDPVATFFADWRGADREDVTVRDLLEHASGLPARLVDPPPESRREFEHDICTMPLEYRPRSKSVYSDLGFILLGFLLADRGHASLAAQFDAIRTRLQTDTTRDAGYDLLKNARPAGRRTDGVARPQTEPLTFDLPPGLKRHVAPTLPMDDDARRGRALVGEVHDNYAATLGGVAGHAGLFGTARSVADVARVLLRAARGDARMPPPFAPALMAQFTTKSAVAASSRALGWDTMLPTSSCGAHMSSAAFGHVGFTGTSLWIDPERDRYFVLLTNRARGGGTLDQMREVRRAFHDALEDL
jgi:CubicO group peptidase (beta-lactamase class C family)